MGRKIKNSDGQKLTSKITLSVTPQMQDDIKTLAEIINGGNVNDCIVNIMDTVIKKNSAEILKVQKARKNYTRTLFKANVNLDFLAQDLKGGDDADDWSRTPTV